jgi:hypothetical protein
MSILGPAKIQSVDHLDFFEFLIAWSVKTWLGFWEGGLKYFDPELVDSFVENKNSDIKVICSDSVIMSILGPAKIQSVDLLDICWTCSYPLSCTITLWQKSCKSEQMTLISEFLFSVFQAKLFAIKGKTYLSSENYKTCLIMDQFRNDVALWVKKLRGRYDAIFIEPEHIVTKIM